MERMEKLVAILNEHAYYYYVLDDPRISDKEYDLLYDELVKLEEETGKVLPSSPTRRVGGAPLDAFEKHRHIVPLYSLDKAKTMEEIEAWEERMKKILGEDAKKLEYTLEYKFDGLTINLTYENGRLVYAATRGDGEVGEGILAQIQTIKSIPLEIPFKGRMEVQGEGIMRLSALEEYNKNVKEPLKNARNAAAGALRNLDPKATAARKLDAFFYSIGYIEGQEFASHTEMIEFLKKNKFKVSDFERCFTSLKVLEISLKEAEKKRDMLDFLIDGMVIKVNDFAMRERLGYTQKFPRWAIAYKFEAEEMTTIVKEVTWEVGRTGKLTPLAHLEPVELGGATIKRATLNNYEDILRKQVRLGCRVFIRRSNDVIPEILGAVPGQEGLNSIEKPKSCPACGSALEQIGPNVFCINSLSCKPQLISRIAHFASRDAMDIESLSEKTAKLLLEERGVKDIAQLYELTFDDLIDLPGFKEKKAKNLLTGIEESKHPELDRFIFALGINNVGKKTAKDLAKRYGTFERLTRATREELEEIPDVGGIVAQSILDYFASPQVESVLRRLWSLGIEPQPFEEKAGALQGKNIVVTGTLETYTRNGIKTMIEAQGGNVQSAIAKSTDLLIAGEKAGSKLKKAQELEIPVWTEKDFLDFLRDSEKK